jgi:hypothetical protein
MSNDPASGGFPPMSRRTLRDEGLQHAFDRDGFVTTPLLDKAEAEALRTAMAQLRPEDGFAPEGRWHRISYHCSFLDRSRDYRRRAFELGVAALGGAVERLLSGFSIIQANFYVKPAGRGHFGLHQNWPLLTSLDDVSVTIWCPLVDLTEENGPLALVPGSHKLLPHVQGPDTRAYLDGLEPELVASGLVRTMRLEAGQGCIFDDSLIHGSAQNLSTAPRPAVQLICAPADATPVYYRNAGDGLFEMIEAQPEFWLSHDVEDLCTRPAHWTSLGFVRSRNRQVDMAELKRLLASGDAGRRAGHPLEGLAP